MTPLPTADFFVGVPLLLGVLAGLFQVGGYALYIRNKSIDPNPVTWLMFAYGTVLLTALEINRNAVWYELLLPIACATMAIYVSYLCWMQARKNNPQKWWPHDWWPNDWADQLAFSGDIFITLAYMAAWLLAASTLISAESKSIAVLIFLIGSNLTTVTAFIPILRSTKINPRRERSLPWATWTVAYCALLIATVMERGLFTELIIYPLSCLVLHGIVAWIARPKSINSYNLILPQRNREATEKTIEVRRSDIHGNGIFARVNIEKGEGIQYIEGAEVTKSVRSKEESESISNWIGLGEDSWIDTSKSDLRHINHSCEPNAAIDETRNLIALETIKKDDEITMDYSLTDADLHWNMDCACGKKTCRKKIGAIQTIPTEIFTNKISNIPSNFQRIYIRNHISAQDTVQQKHSVLNL